ncbi:universal stress protein [Olleya sp. HaHaR_3_96]|uniref:universal stress protein n=1 Tax=Olleya sp. HaHaR_3_96 TaxID=2745560 RepID=UPI001C500C04|nr:universal stress protein [Olleya sp. HaHaR_3_96]QXP58338.1 universal stress protein [Olleya sp. HaHaR_3_96]
MVQVLIPTDFSDNAMNALKYALELYKHERVEFYFLNAYQDEVYSNDELLNRNNFEDILESVRTNSQTLLESFLKAANTLAPNPRYKYHIISAYNSLIEETDIIVNAKNIDLIIMGTRGKTNDKTIRFGSNTLQVLKYVQCPILVIPENYQYKRPKHIVFTTNFMIRYKRRELKLLNRIATPYRSKIDLLYLSKYPKLSIRQEDNKAFIMETLPENNVNYVNEDHKNITDAIQSYITKNDIDLLVMVNTRHSFLEHILFKSTIDTITLHIEIPFLVMQNMGRY